jgi:Kef-type K+ transport system membrane component KefB
MYSGFPGNPITEPVLVFGIALVVILIVPILFSRLKIPGIIGLILSGMLLGSSGFNILSGKGSMELLGTVGLLYLMFLAGLELDIQTFQKTKNRSIVFGLFTFFVPLFMGYVTCRWLLGYNPLPSLLVASMFSTQTLISYPIVSRFRLTKIEVVGITIGGTIITDTLVLLFLAIITALWKGNIDTSFWIILSGSTVAYLAFILFIFPKIARWFFKNMATEHISQYVFVLTMVFVAGILAKWVGFEPIIGAFLAGIVFNRQIPHSSSLMNRIEFIGNAIFIPFFLLYVGMLIDLKVFISGWNAIQMALILVLVALLSKWVAAYLTQKVFLYKPVHRRLIFGLSSSHAAAIIAVILIGFQMGIVDINVLNSTILIIFVSCITSSFVTEHASREIIVKEKPYHDKIEVRERILVPVSNPETIDPLLDFARYLKTHPGKEPIYVLTVVKSEDSIPAVSTLFSKAAEHGAASDCRIETATRMDINVASGIVRACKELMISEIVIGWNGRFSPKQWVFGTILENVLAETRQPVYVAGIRHPLSYLKQILVMVPPFAEYEVGFANSLKALQNLANQMNARIFFYIQNDKGSFKDSLGSLKFRINYTIVEVSTWGDFFSSALQMPDDNLLFMLSARQGAISHNSKLDGIPRLISRRVRSHSFVIVYPAQPKVTSVDTRSFLTGSGQLPIDESHTEIKKPKPERIP